MAQQLIRAIYDYDAQNSEELSFIAVRVCTPVARVFQPPEPYTLGRRPVDPARC